MELRDDNSIFLSGAHEAGVAWAGGQRTRPTGKLSTARLALRLLDEAKLNIIPDLRESHSSLMRRLARLCGVRFFGRVALVEALARLAHALVRVLAAERQLEAAKALHSRRSMRLDALLPHDWYRIQPQTS